MRKIVVDRKSEELQVERMGENVGGGRGARKHVIWCRSIQVMLVVDALTHFPDT